jgi:ABC-2 type transport system permease protein
VAGLVCAAAGVLVLGIPLRAASLPAVVLWVILGTAGWYFFFAWLSLRVRGFNAYHTTTSGLYLMLMFVSNLFYPAERLPGAVQWLAWANPITWQVDLLRYHIYGAGTPRVLQMEAAGFVLFLLASFWVANRSLNGPIE